MSYPKKLLRLRPKRGFIADTAAHEASDEFYTLCKNVSFRDGFATRVRGQRSAYADEIAIIDPDVLFHAINAVFADANWWLLFDRDGAAWAIQSGVVLSIGGAILGPALYPWQYSSARINSVPVITNSLSDPVYWDGTGDLQVLPGWPAGDICHNISVLKFHIFACNIIGPEGTFNNEVRWSAATEPGTVPGTWEPLASNDAGSVLLSDSPGPIMTAVTLGDALFIYKRRATYQVRYVGGQNVFNFRKVNSTVGALTPRSVCDIGGAHLIVTDGDIVISDGTTRRSIGESRVKDWMFDQLDPGNHLLLFCVYNPVRDEVIIAFPSTGSDYCDIALVYDLSRDAFGVVELPQVTHAPMGIIRDDAPSDTWENRTEPWVEATAPWAASLSSSTVASLVMVTGLDFIQTDVNDPTQVDAVIGRTGLSFGDPERIKFVKGLRVRTRRPYGEFFVRIGGQMTANGATTWSSEVLISGTQEIVNAFAIGRYISVSIRSADTNSWKITGIDIEAELRGYF